MCYLPLGLAPEFVCGAFVGATYTSRYKVHLKVPVLVKGAHNIKLCFAAGMRQQYCSHKLPVIVHESDIRKQ